MSASHNLIHRNRQEIQLLARISKFAEDAVGTTTVGTVAMAGALGNWAASANGWIMFFLVSKPLWDLTWRWKFFSFIGQGVNVQTFLALLVLGLSALAVLYGDSWRRLPRRVSVFLGCATFSVLLSPSSEGFNELLRLLAGVAFFYTAGPLLAEPRRFDRFAKGLLVVCAVPVVLSFLQAAGMLSYDYFDWIDEVETGRATGTYQHPLGLIYLLVYVFPIGLYIANGSNQSRSARKCAWLFLISAAIALALTYHRVGYLAIASEVMIASYLHWGRKAAIAFLLVLVVVGLLSFSFIQLLYAPVGESVDRGSDDSGQHFLRGRGFQWILYMESYLSGGPVHWVLGRGGSVIPGVDPDDDSYVLSPNEPHNDYIRILHAYGLLGLGLYVSILAMFFRQAIHRLNSTDRFARSLARILLPGLVAIGLLSLTTEPMRYPTAAWYLFALASALFTLETNTKLTRMVKSPNARNYSMQEQKRTNPTVSDMGLA